MKLSEFELDVMELFWKHDTELSTSEVHAMICESKDVAHTTVKTILFRLEEKEAIVRLPEKRGRSLMYEAIVTPEFVSTSRIPELLDRFFKGNRTKLLAHLMTDLRLTKKELKQMKDLVNELEKKKKR